MSASDPIEALLGRALELHRAGNAAAARPLYAAVVTARPGAAPVWPLYALAAAADGDPQTGADALAHALVLSPGHGGALTNLGPMLLDLGASAASARVSRRAARLDPGQSAPRNNLGSALRQLGFVAEAIAAHAHAVALDPAEARAWLNLGVALRAAERAGPAIGHYRRALILAPDWVEAERNLGNALQSLGDRAGADAAYGRIIARTGDRALDLKRALLLPIVAMDRAEIAEARARLALTIDRLTREGLSLRDPLSEIGQTAFHLAYHDADDRPLQEALARLYRQACPDLTVTAPHVASWRGAPRRRPRLVIVSELLRAHTIGRLNHGLIRHLDRARVEVVIATRPWPGDPLRAAMASDADGVIDLPDGLAAARAALAAAEADIILYADIGMTPLTYFLAFARLARVQAVTWGHPDTTGIDTLDLFVSCAAMEPPGAEAHYSERLARTPGPGVRYARPAPAPVLTREDFGLPAAGPLFVCPQTPQKLHPDFDAAVSAILGACRDARLVLVHGHDPHVGQRLLGRMARAMPDAHDRIVMLETMPGPRFRALLALADVMLDPFHYSGGHTSLEAFADATPIVTWPGRFMRGRHTAGFLDVMGLGDDIARDADDYVARAIALGQDRGARAALSARIAQAAPALYDRQDVVEATLTILLDALGEARPA